MSEPWQDAQNGRSFWSAPAKRSDDGAFPGRKDVELVETPLSKAGSRFACPRSPK